MADDSVQAISDLADGLRDLGATPTIVTAGFESCWPATVRCRGNLVHRVSFPRRLGWSARRYCIALGAWLRSNRSSFDVACVSQLNQDAVAVINAFRDTGIPVVLRSELDERSDLDDPDQLGRPEQRILRHCRAGDAIVVSDSAQRKRLAATGFDADIIHEIPVGVQSFHGRSEETQRSCRLALSDINHDLLALPGVKVAVCVGRLHPSRNLPQLLRAWRRVSSEYPQSRLWLIGDGPHREKLHQQIQHTDLAGRVVLPGSFDHTEEIFFAADAYIQPDEKCETPVSLLRAMATGLPIIACNTQTQRIHLADGETGRIVPANRPAELARAIIDTFEDPTTASRRARNAAIRVSSHQSVLGMARDYLGLFERLIAGRTADHQTSVGKPEMG